MLDFNVIDLLTVFLVLLLSLTVHESAHAWTADRLGDPTARALGRISMNPLVHVDPVGTVVLPLVAFASGIPVIGWAKPVPVDVARLRRGRRDYVLVAAAGPASNIALAVLASSAMGALQASSLDVAVGGAGPLLYRFVSVAFTLNLLLAVFNMLPVPPLDGGSVVGGLLPASLADPFDRLVRPYGFLILYALILTGMFWTIIGPPYLFLARLLGP
ncbi:MAG: site-2 protease family protein [Vicinamibacterales bacterium]|nr:site-2 protease family protein [Acidobacteriota bacterium]MDP6374029.1 site-2 protease family protein [Vicinamibacterales bacterium]MDP6610625.1 site-2 protease family protein [Vicinamibacterales bacterium]HAK56792.1 site-2 protease family protein [Acidobacteriota bacterium]